MRVLSVLFFIFFNGGSVTPSIRVNAFGFVSLRTRGLFASCLYVPQSEAQLHACAVSAAFNKDPKLPLTEKFYCEEIDNEDNCKQAVPGANRTCVWIKNDHESVKPGSCLHQRLTSYGVGNTKYGITMFYNAYKKHNVPNTTNLNECLKHSYNRTNCELAQDRDKKQCGWCTGLPDYYPFDPPTCSLCLPKHLLPAACDLLKVESTLYSRKNPTPFPENMTECHNSSSSSTHTTTPLLTPIDTKAELSKMRT